MHTAATGFGDRLNFGRLAFSQRHGLGTAGLQVVMRQHHFREVDTFALAAKFQQRQQALVEDGALFDGGVAVVEDLRKEGIEPDEGAYVGLEQDHGIQLVLCRLGCGLILFGLSGLQRCLSSLVALQYAIPHRLQRGDQLALLGVRI